MRILEEREEDLLRQQIVNNKNIAGVDEVGRGALFGPVFAGAVVINKQAEEKLVIAGLRDSKKLSQKHRAKLVPIIQNEAIAWGIGQSSNKEIDSLGIRTATENAMIRALNSINLPLEMILVDGVLPLKNWPGFQKTIIEGESAFPSIAAASVLAKEARDDLIKRFAKRFPGYQLESNVGYGTKMHCKALIKLGPTELHRKSFLGKILSK